MALESGHFVMNPEPFNPFRLLPDNLCVFLWAKLIANIDPEENPSAFLLIAIIFVLFIIAISAALGSLGSLCAGALLTNQYDALVERDTYIPLGAKLGVALSSMQVVGGFVAYGGLINFSSFTLDNTNDKELLSLCCGFIPLLIGILLITYVIGPMFIVGSLADVSPVNVLIAIALYWLAGLLRKRLLSCTCAFVIPRVAREETMKSDVRFMSNVSTICAKSFDLATAMLIYVVLIATDRIVDGRGGLAASLIFGIFGQFLFIPAFPGLYPEVFRNSTSADVLSNSSIYSEVFSNFTGNSTGF